MGTLYGKTTKRLRTVTNDTYEIQAQRYKIIPFFYCDDTVPAYNDGDDLTNKGFKIGTRMTKHKLDLVMKPSSTDPQRIYMGYVKLSFYDVYNPYITGIDYDLASNGQIQDAGTKKSFLNFTHTKDDLKAIPPQGQLETDAQGIQAVKLDDYFKHFVHLNKPMTIFDQRPMVSNRMQRIPAKVKRINPYTWYGLWLYNDSTRTETATDNNVSFDIKQYIEAYAL